jgi:hypothetical protein
MISHSLIRLRSSTPVMGWMQQARLHSVRNHLGSHPNLGKIYTGQDGHLDHLGSHPDLREIYED